jgi:hypothetical protein
MFRLAWRRRAAILAMVQDGFIAGLSAPRWLFFWLLVSGAHRHL